MDKERTSVLLDKEIMVKLQMLSRKTNRSKTFLINEAVAEFVAKKTLKKKLNIIGIADSKDPSFAREDEKYLKDEGFGED